MKVKTKTARVESGGVRNQGEFRIKNSAKAFSILSSGLYANKYAAILRELGCNAYDSHVEAGKADVPFYVRLPSTLNPTLVVRDYGIGLDHQGVIDVYTTYFESTKQDSNDFVGCMGLGSKSPFSYTDNFSITAIKDGVRRLYTAFINEKGIPSIAQLHEEETDEGNGLEVSFAVTNRSDMHSFADEARRIYKWFKVKPTIDGQDVEIDDVNYSEKNIIPGVHAVAQRNHYRSTSYALMGNVAYPISLADSTGDGAVRERVRKLYSECGLVIEFNIGDLDIAASREELSYDAETIKTLYEKGEKVIDQLGVFLGNKVASRKNKWDKLTELSKLVKDNRRLFRPVVAQYLEKHKKDFFKHINVGYEGDMTVSFLLSDLTEDHDKVKTSKYYLRTIRDYVNYQYLTRTVASRLGSESVYLGQAYGSALCRTMDKDTTVIFQDDSFAMTPRLKKAFEDKQITESVLIFRTPAKEFDREKFYKRLRKKLGNPKNVFKSSQLPKVSTAAVKKPGSSAYKFSASLSRRRYVKSCVMELVPDSSSLDFSINSKKLYLYVPAKGRKVELGTRSYTATEFMETLRRKDLLSFLGVSSDKIYALNKTMLKEKKKDKSWMRLDDYLIEQLKQIDMKKLEANHRLDVLLPALGDANFDINKANKKDLEDISKHAKKSLFGRLAALYLEEQRASGTEQDGERLNYLHLIDAVALFLDLRDKQIFCLDGKKMSAAELRGHFDSRRANASKAYKPLIQQAKDRYPLIQYLESVYRHRHGPMWKEVIKYVKLLDKID